MSEWQLPKLREDKDVLVQAKYAVSNIDSICGILTCLSCETKKNDLTSMAFVLTELANELCKSTEKIETIIWKVKKEREFNEQVKKN